MSRPALRCFATTSPTALRMRSAKAARSTGLPSSLAYIIWMRSSGRGRLPVWVVRKRSTLWGIVLTCRGFDRKLSRKLRYRVSLRHPYNIHTSSDQLTRGRRQEHSPLLPQGEGVAEGDG